MALGFQDTENSTPGLEWDPLFPPGVQNTGNEKRAFSWSVNLFIWSKLAAASGFPGSGSSSEQPAFG